MHNVKINLNYTRSSGFYDDFATV